jgi:hypothetical protein
MAEHFIPQTIYIETCGLSDQNLFDARYSLVGTFLDDEEVTINTVDMAHVQDEAGNVLNSQLVIGIINQQSSGFLSTDLSRKDVDKLYQEAYGIGCYCVETIESDLQVSLNMANGHVPTIACEFYVNGKPNPIGKINDAHVWQDYQPMPQEEEEVEVLETTTTTYVYQQPQTILIVEDPSPYYFSPYYDPYYYGW